MAESGVALVGVDQGPGGGLGPEPGQGLGVGGGHDHGGQGAGAGVPVAGLQDAELVAFGVGQDRPGDLALADVGPGGAEVEEAGDQGCLGGG